MLFEDAFIEHIKTLPLEGAHAVGEIVRERLSTNHGGWVSSDKEILIEAYALLTSLDESGLITFRTNAPSMSGRLNDDCIALYNYIESVEAETRIRLEDDRLVTLKSKFAQALSGRFTYEFSAGDLDQIQGAMNDLRTKVTEAPFLEEPHRQRLLRRLERLQSELHKKVSDLDRFWGLIGDAGVVLGKFGEDAKPIADRIREIAGIVWRTQARTEELPSDAPIPLLAASCLDESA